MFGGLDVHEKMCTENCAQSGTGPGPGHLLTYRLDTSVDPPQWDTGWTVQMGRARWYPTSISMADGDTFVGGHGPTAEPGNACAPIYTENPSSGALYQVTYDRTYELLEWGTSPAFGPVVTSYLDSQSCGNESQFELARLLAYPRIHLLSNKLLFQTDAPMFPSPFGFGCRVMDVDPATVLCGDGRWSVQLNLPQPKRNGGNTVHLVFLDEFDGTPRDVIYAIGGTDGSDEAIFDPGGPVHDLVEKVVLVDPDLASWAGSGSGSPPNLNTKRFNHNSVILLDGSVLVNGGWHGDSIPSPPGTVLNAERYRPPELFDIAEGSGNDVWKEMTTAVEPSHRRYHSVAGLLPDGRTFSAGGEDGGGIQSAHTVSVYSPSYLFHPRPEITSAPATITNLDNQGAPFSVNVTLSSPNASVYRLGLIRNSSVTHAWDMNQRYVELAVSQVIPMGGNDYQLEVQPPQSGFAAPLGSYLMSVVEENAPPPPPAGFFLEQRWIPSPGVWVQVVDE